MIRKSIPFSSVYSGLCGPLNGYRVFGMVWWRECLFSKRFDGWILVAEHASHINCLSTIFRSDSVAFTFCTFVSLEVLKNHFPLSTFCRKFRHPLADPGNEQPLGAGSAGWRTPRVERPQRGQWHCSGRPRGRHTRASGPDLFACIVTDRIVTLNSSALTLNASSLTFNTSSLIFNSLSLTVNVLGLTLNSLSLTLNVLGLTFNSVSLTLNIKVWPWTSIPDLEKFHFEIEGSTCDLVKNAFGHSLWGQFLSSATMQWLGAK